MRRIAIPGAVAAALVAAAVVGASRIGGAAWGSSDAAPARPVVDEALLAEALESVRPRRATMDGTIAFYDARLADGQDDVLVRSRLGAAHLLRFRAYGDGADLDAAEAHLAAWRGSGALAAEALSAEASLHLARHAFPEAVDAARAANLRSGDFDPALRLRLFDALWAVGALDEAAALLALPYDEASAAFLSRRARVRDRRGDVEGARDDLRRVADAVGAYAQPAPVRAWALVEAGHAEHHAGDPAGAAARFRQALTVVPGSPAALEGLAALAAGVDRDLDAAIRLTRHALAQGGHLDLLAGLADLEAARGDTAAAAALRKAFVEGATADPALERAHRRALAFVLADAEPCRALVIATRDLAERRDPGAWDAVAWTRYWTGDLAGAGAAGRQATAWGVPEPGTAYRAGVIAAAAGDEARARRLLGVALKGDAELSAEEVRDARARLEGNGGIAPDPEPAACPA